MNYLNQSKETLLPKEGKIPILPPVSTPPPSHLSALHFSCPADKSEKNLDLIFFFFFTLK